MMKSQAGLFALHVPYRGAAPALQDLLAGQVDFHFDPGVGLQHAKNGRLKLLAVGSMKRSPLFPDVPTLDEAGLKGFDADTVFGFYAPAGTPADVVARLNREINRILGTQAVKDRLVAMGGEALPLTPAEFGARAQEDYRRFGAIIKERRIVAD
jgi:tripartite-type tricarboxylate transporter receptor subunit TctC